MNLLARAHRALPVGSALDDGTWGSRHRFLLAALGAHVPVLAVVGLAAGWTAPHVAAELAVPILAGLVGLAARGRGVRSAAVTLGLAGSAAVLVHLTHGQAESHFHYFVVLGLVALYQDWRSYLLAIGFVVVEHGIGGTVAPGAGTAAAWNTAALHGTYVLAASVAHLVLWHASARERASQQAAHEQLYEGDRAVVRQLQQAEELKAELIAIVSHEFRAPLTSILGFATTLDRRLEQLDPARARTCAQAIERQAARLGRLVDGLLAASADIRPGPGDVADVAAVAREVAEELGDGVRVDVPDGLCVAVGVDPLHQIVLNLAGNAVKFAEPGTSVTVSAAHDGAAIVVEVANVGPPIDTADLDRIFEAFVQADAEGLSRRQGVGLGLHIVRKLVAAHGGVVRARNDPPRVVFTAALPPAPLPATRPATVTLLP